MIIRIFFRFNGLFPGWGNTRVIGCYHSFDKGNQTILDTDKMHKYEGKWHPFERHRLGLNTLFSLSIGGNDLLSSSLYTAGICATYGGKVNKIYILNSNNMYDSWLLSVCVWSL
jgi:hypothetical protein